MSEATPAKFKEWAVLELFGHRKLAGLVSEAEIAGGAFLRLDIPGEDGDVATQFYNPSAVYAMTPVTEELARQVAKAHRPAPVTRWELPQLPEGTLIHDNDEDRD
jgi:hypothetical protein